MHTDTVNRTLPRAGAGVVAALALALALTGCAPPVPAESPSSVIAPVVLSVDELQGATVNLVVGQVLDIDTGDLPVDSYRGEVSDTAVLDFVEGRDDGSATYNPGVTALAPGTAEVMMTNVEGGIEELIFTVDVAG